MLSQYILIIGFLLSFSTIDSEVLTIEKIREDYMHYATDKKKCESAIESLANVENKNSLQLGYYGALQTIWANHASNPIGKLNTFIKGKKNIEKAIAEDNDNTELRFIRLSIQTNAPYFLNYRSNIEEDKSFIIKRKNEIQSISLRNNINALLKE